jgi:hypothetical protein
MDYALATPSGQQVALQLPSPHTEQEAPQQPLMSSPKDKKASQQPLLSSSKDKEATQLSSPHTETESSKGQGSFTCKGYAPTPISYDQSTTITSL